MGVTLGVFTEKEVNDLGPSERELLKQHIINSIRGSEQVHKILSSNPKLIRDLMKNPQIRKVARAKAKSLKNRLRQKKK
jgi:hypothetical protein